MKKIVIIGGGTFSPVRNHLSLCAPAFGSTAKIMFEHLSADKKFFVDLVLTKMANPESELITNDDISDYIDTLLKDPDVNTIVLSAAMCDFNAKIDKADFHGPRLKTSDGDFDLTLTPAENWKSNSLLS